MMPNAREEHIVVMRLAGTLWQGEAISTAVAGQPVLLPAEVMMDPGDQLFLSCSDIAALGVRAGDLLVVEPRKAGRARTGEAVIVIADGAALAGRWWQKQGRRALMDERLEPIAEGKEMRILGAITLILRDTPAMEAARCKRGTALGPIAESKQCDSGDCKAGPSGVHAKR